MIAKTYILQNLEQIERLFNSTTSARKSLYFSKLAVIELCGWIEMSMDDIALRLASRRLKEPTFLKYVNDVVKRTHGFEYERHFLRMIEAVIGVHGIEKMNKGVDPMIITPCQAALTSLKNTRNQLAHQYIKGTTLIIDAPSVTRGRFPILWAGLQNIETVLKGQ